MFTLEPFKIREAVYIRPFEIIVILRPLGIATSNESLTSQKLLSCPFNLVEEDKNSRAVQFFDSLTTISRSCKGYKGSRVLCLSGCQAD